MSRGAEHRVRTAGLGVAFAVVSCAMIGVLAVSSINYRMSAGWMAGIVGILIVFGGIAALTGKAMGWKGIRLLGLLGLFALGGMALFAFMYSDAGAALARRMYVARTNQIADSLGFVALMPTGEQLPTDMLPVDELPGSDAGIALNYNGFELWERKAQSAATEADLLQRFAPGAEPMGDRIVIPADARITTLTVGGAPAVAVVFDSQAVGSPAKSSATETTSMFITVRGDVEVMFWSAGMEKYADGKWQKLPAITPAGFAKIAESLKPVK